MDNTPSGLKRPADADTMGSTAATLRQHANSIQAGAVQVTTLAASTVTGTVSYPIPYPSGVIPRVLVTPSTGSPNTVEASVGNITNTGFSYYVYRPSGYSGALWLQWFALGQGSEVGG